MLMWMLMSSTKKSSLISSKVSVVSENIPMSVQKRMENVNSHQRLHNVIYRKYKVRRFFLEEEFNALTTLARLQG